MGKNRLAWLFQLYLIGFFQGEAADFDLDHGTDVFVGRAEDTLVVDIEHGGVAVVVYGLLPFGGLSGGDCFYAGAGESVGFEPFFEFRLEDCGDIVSGDFPEVHYLVVGLAGSAVSVQFIEEEVPVKGYVDVFAETVYESPALLRLVPPLKYMYGAANTHWSTAVTHQSFSTDSGVMSFREDTWSRM